MRGITERELKAIAIVALLVYGIWCLMTGVNHAIVFAIAVIIGGLAGYEYRRRREGG